MPCYEMAKMPPELRRSVSEGRASRNLRTMAPFTFTFMTDFYLVSDSVLWVRRVGSCSAALLSQTSMSSALIMRLSSISVPAGACPPGFSRDRVAARSSRLVTDREGHGKAVWAVLRCSLGAAIRRAWSCYGLGGGVLRACQ